MSGKNFSSRFSILFGIIILLFFGGISVFVYFAGSLTMFIFILVFGFIGFIMTIGMGWVMKGQSKDKDVQDSDSLIIIDNEEKPFSYRINSKSDRYKIDAITILNPPIEEKCMISKLPLSEGKEVLQCPSCNSHYIKKYLEDWIRENSNCPVCKHRIRIDIE